MSKIPMTVRIGKVSKIDYKNGLICATYPDLDDAVTDDFPVFSFTGEYKMPAVGDEILVLHLSNGQSAGIVMGRYWNEDNPPAVYGKNVFRKELGDEPGESYVQYKDKAITFCDPKAGAHTLKSIDDRLKALESTASNHEGRISSLEAQI